MTFSVIVILLLFLMIYTIFLIKKADLCSNQGRDDSETNTLIIPIKGHKEDAEFVLRKAAIKLKWKNSGKNSSIICLDCGMDSETRKICSLVCKDYDFMYMQQYKQANFENK